MDASSHTIDRHTPIIPPSLWCGLSPEREAAQTLLKNSLISNSRKKPAKNRLTKIITDELLLESSNVMDEISGDLDDDLRAYLQLRHLTEYDISKYKMCSTELLVSKLSAQCVQNLSLCIPDHLLRFTNGESRIRGISIPCFFSGKFFGFVTRVLNHDMIKYTVSILHRLCYGVETVDDSEIYVVEGVFDAIALKKTSRNVLGMGDSQPNYFKMGVASCFKRINLAFDDDLGGWLGVRKAYIILTQMFNRHIEDIKIWAISGGKDPAEAFGHKSGRFEEVSILDVQEKINAWRKWHRENHDGEF